MFQQQINQLCDRCLGCANAQCVQSCPIGTNIPLVLQLAKNGNFRQAVQAVGHPFGEICGYVCPHDVQCLGGCVLNAKQKGVCAGHVEKQLFERFPYEVIRQSAALSHLKIAVVGGGVAGITFATKAFEYGAQVTLFNYGKLLSTLSLIPQFRLPSEAIERVVESTQYAFNLVDCKVDNAQLQQLLCQYDVVYLAVGNSVQSTLGTDGESLATTYTQCLQGDVQGEVLVVGGGNTAIDCARKCNKNGAKTTIVYRRSQQEMPCFATELQSALKEGVQLLTNFAPTLLEKKDGKLVLTVAQTQSQNRGKLEITNNTRQLVCDSVVSATGSRFDKSLVVDIPQELANKLYLGGDCNGGYLVAHAVSQAMQTFDEIYKKHAKV